MKNNWAIVCILPAIVGVGCRANNHACGTAEMLALGPLERTVVVSGNTINASYQDGVEFCVDTDAVGYFGGAWYQISNVTPNLGLRANVDANHWLSVYSNTCESLECVGGGERGTYVWAASSPSYYLFVQRYLYPGDYFTLQLETFETASNDLCQSALPLKVDGSNQVASAAQATIEELPFCENQRYLCYADCSTPGIWYSLVGNGSDVTISTCTSNDTITYGSKITVFQGACDSLECVDTALQLRDCPSPNDNGITVELATQLDTVYHVNVQGSSFEYQRVDPLDRFFEISALISERDESPDPRGFVGTITFWFDSFFSWLVRMIETSLAFLRNIVGF